MGGLASIRAVIIIVIVPPGPEMPICGATCALWHLSGAASVIGCLHLLIACEGILSNRKKRYRFYRDEWLCEHVFDSLERDRRLVSARLLQR